MLSYERVLGSRHSRGAWLALPVLVLLIVALAPVSSGSTATAQEPTCAGMGGIANHGHHVVGDYVTGSGGIGGGLEWPPAGGEVGSSIAGSGAAVPGGPGPGFHFPNGFAPGASFCLEQSQSPGVHL